MLGTGGTVAVGGGASSRQTRTRGFVGPGWARTEVNVEESCVGALHEDLLGGAVQRLVHEVDAVPDHGPDPLGKALRAGARTVNVREPGRPARPPPRSLCLPASSFPTRPSLPSARPPTRAAAAGSSHGNVQKGTAWASSCPLPALSLLEGAGPPLTPADRRRGLRPQAPPGQPQRMRGRRPSR